MSRTEIRQVASFLLECQETLWELHGTESALLCLNRLYEIARWLRIMTRVTSDDGQKSVLQLIGQNAQRLQRQIEERLAARN